MNDDKIINIVKDLIEKTKTKKARWYETKDGQYALALNKGTVIISKYDNYEVGPGVIFSILNSKGYQIARIDILENDEEFTADDYLTLISLYDEARKVYHKIDETLDGISREINSIGEIGKVENPNNQGQDESDDLPF